ncbi:YkvA family protein [Exiguobacterium artemiae]|uniref:YkvA family protein n=1 Tax=Exiguobacterium artemiae TaxID=340145 RepID=UPI0029652A1D|nr:YkvA family protein [Exiguobacterium sibiricum]MDW2885350.1 YkvA family protein [Exiguobacterium sibiricum]
MLEKLKDTAKKLKKQIFILYFAYQDERVAWYTKVFTASVVAYAFSPIDLIPDFIPVLGYLDDIILVPLGILLALRMLPQEVIDDCTVKAEQRLGTDKPKNWLVGALILLLWCGLTIWIGLQIYDAVR